MLCTCVCLCVLRVYLRVYVCAGVLAAYFSCVCVVGEVWVELFVNQGPRVRVIIVLHECI